MFSLLLAIIYLAFISLGLPDSLIGSGWPVMHTQLQVPLSYAGIITMIIAACTIVSSLMSDRLTARFGTGVVTAVSVVTTAIALFGFSLSGAFWMLCLWAIPYGLGAGAVDASLNNFVALHYASRQMNWLHCFWGVGAAISPYVMSLSLTNNLGWAYGYRFIGIIQVVLSVILFLSLPLWKRKEAGVGASAGAGVSAGSGAAGAGSGAGSTADTERPQSDTAAGQKPARVHLSLAQIVRIPGVVPVLLAFFAYCAIEQTAGLWASSYLVQSRGVEPTVAAEFASLFYLGITGGRFIAGVIAGKLNDRQLVRVGVIILLVGILLILLPFGAQWPALAGLVLTGLGCAPIYPSLIHATPANFGAHRSQAVIGVQMAAAYVGTTFMPPLFGAIASVTGVWIFALYLLLFALLTAAMAERVNRTVDAGVAEQV